MRETRAAQRSFVRSFVGSPEVTFWTTAEGVPGGIVRVICSVMCDLDRVRNAVRSRREINAVDFGCDRQRLDTAEEQEDRHARVGAAG